MLGIAQAGTLRQVLADFRAADTLFDVAGIFDLPPGDASEFPVPLGPTHRIVLRCGNAKPAKLPEGGINWNLVDRLRVMEITQ